LAELLNSPNNKEEKAKELKEATKRALEALAPAGTKVTVEWSEEPH
jgi:surface antigen